MGTIIPSLSEESPRFRESNVHKVPQLLGGRARWGLYTWSAPCHPLLLLQPSASSCPSFHSLHLPPLSIPSLLLPSHQRETVGLPLSSSSVPQLQSWLLLAWCAMTASLDSLAIPSEGNSTGPGQEAMKTMDNQTPISAFQKGAAVAKSLDMFSAGYSRRGRYKKGKVLLRPPNKMPVNWKRLF